MRKYYFKVVYGYKTNDFTSIEAGGDLERAIYAWTEKIPVSLGDKIIDGKTILRIEPHVQKYTGWRESYQYGGVDDMAQIKRDLPKEIESVLSMHKQHVAGLLEGNNTREVGMGGALLLLQSKNKK